MNQEPTPQDLADKFKGRAEGIKAIKSTERNALCPCCCGKKTKKCEKGKLVLQFKKMLRGSVLTEVLVAYLLFGLAIAAIAAIKGNSPTHPTLNFFRAHPDTLQSKP